MTNKHIYQKRQEVAKREGADESQRDIATASKYMIYAETNNNLCDKTELMEEILWRDNMKAALKKVKANKGCAGIDNMEISELEPYLKEHWQRIKADILAGNYKPQAIKQIEIPKTSGGKRVLGVPVVIDRLIQQAIMQILQGYIDQSFSESSYGFRPGRSAHQAIMRVKEDRGI
jgi:RNA-directed DNA polymerase